MTTAALARLQNFFEKIRSETYPEPPSTLHSIITRQMLDHVAAKYPLAEGAKVLDVGCGQGVALEDFRRRGLNTVGITLNAEDARVCREKGYDVREMDQSFLEFDAEQFDFIWCRHCLEHSIAPYFTLHEFYRVLKPGGYLYVEVPAPDTSCQHQGNRNHYSVFGQSMWLSLIARAGFQNLETLNLNFKTMAGPDTYWVFIQRKLPVPAGDAPANPA